MDTANNKLYKTEDNTALRFWWDTNKNNFQSEKLGRPVYNKVLLVEVINPGAASSTVVHELVREFDEETKIVPVRREPMYSKYKRQIEAFLSDSDDPDLIGTPLDAWPALDVAMVASLKESRIYTVEGLASLSDGKLGLLGMGGRALRDKAKAFLEVSAGNAPTERLAGELSRANEEIERLNATIKELPDVAVLQSRIAELEGELAKAKAKPAKVSV
jgi:hypothetical protein